MTLPEETGCSLCPAEGELPPTARSWSMGTLGSVSGFLGVSSSRDGAGFGFQNQKCLHPNSKDFLD